MKVRASKRHFRDGRFYEPGDIVEIGKEEPLADWMTKVRGGGAAQPMTKPDDAPPVEKPTKGTAAAKRRPPIHRTDREMVQQTPLKVGEAVLIVQADGRKVREFIPDRLDDESVSGMDLSVISDHLLRRYPITRWAYAKAPSSVVWRVRSNGCLLTMTDHKEHEVAAWAQHDTDGVVEDVCSVREGRDDAVYFLVKRTINGVERRFAERRFVERMASREIYALDDRWFVDCGFKYEPATAQTEFTGLWRLEGKTVSTLADGNVMPQQVVAHGKVTINVGAKVVHIGLPYVSQIQTLPTVLLPQAPSSGAVKGAPEIIIHVENSRGVFGGPTFDQLYEWKQRRFEPVGDPIALYSGSLMLPVIVLYRRGDSYCIQQVDPLPLTIDSLAPRVSYDS